MDKQIILSDEETIKVIDLLHQQQKFRWYATKKIPLDAEVFQESLNRIAEMHCKFKLDDLEINYESFKQPNVTHHQAYLPVVLRTDQMSAEEIVELRFDQAYYGLRDTSDPLHGKRLLDLFSREDSGYVMEMVDLRYQDVLQEDDLERGIHYQEGLKALLSSFDIPLQLLR